MEDVITPGVPQAAQPLLHHYDTVHAREHAHNTISHKSTQSTQSTARRTFTCTMVWARPRGASAEREGEAAALAEYAEFRTLRRF